MSDAHCVPCSTARLSSHTLMPGASSWSHPPHIWSPSFPAALCFPRHYYIFRRAQPSGDAPAVGQHVCAQCSIQSAHLASLISESNRVASSVHLFAVFWIYSKQLSQMLLFLVRDFFPQHCPYAQDFLPVLVQLSKSGTHPSPQNHLIVQVASRGGSFIKRSSFQ